MPAGGHSKQQTNGEWLPWNNGVCIGKQFRLNKFLALIRLALAMRGEDEDQQVDDRIRAKSECRFHYIKVALAELRRTAHQPATDRNNPPTKFSRRLGN